MNCISQQQQQKYETSSQSSKIQENNILKRDVAETKSIEKKERRTHTQTAEVK